MMLCCAALARRRICFMLLLLLLFFFMSSQPPTLSLSVLRPFCLASVLETWILKPFREGWIGDDSSLPLTHFDLEHVISDSCSCCDDDATTPLHLSLVVLTDCEREVETGMQFFWDQWRYYFIIIGIIAITIMMITILTCLGNIRHSFINDMHHSILDPPFQTTIHLKGHLRRIYNPN